MKYLVPAIVPKPVSPFTLSIDGRDPRRSECSHTHSGVHDAFLVLGFNRSLHDVLEVIRREHTFQGFGNPATRGYINTLAPIA